MITTYYFNVLITAKQSPCTVKMAYNTLHYHIGLDRYQYRVSADTRQYQWVSASANTYLSIGTDANSPVIHLPVSTVNTVACTPIVSILYLYRTKT